MYQFIHYEPYSLLPSQNRKSYISIAKEFMRQEHACSHVTTPKIPTIIFGVDAIKANVIIENRVHKARDKLGRKLRKDAIVALAGVCSLPPDIYTSDLNNKTNVLSVWVERNIEYLLAKYGENLLSVVLHLDEGEPIHPHLHFVITIPDTTEYGKANLMYVHEPFLARQTTSGGKKAKFDAYKKAYRKLQDEYHKEVSEKFGLLRLGAKRQRLTRSEYNARKAEATRVRDSLNDFEQQKSAIEGTKQDLATEQAAINKVKKHLSVKIKQLLKREAIAESAIKARFGNKATIKFYSEKIARLKEKNRIIKSTVLGQEKNKSELRNANILNQRKLLEQDNEIKLLKNEISSKDKLIDRIRKSKIITKNKREYNYEV
ncbi:hypothetical protein EK599_19995 [Vibrio sp. T187]|uniref:plasmid recombination protein n=1 Tax=Vibrio TaxID=662 RepID=UPI0010C95B71|nr:MULTISPECIES: plasmid recombination protein [Vibrio]MBW3697969.1 hypothetical protein [Vibrio sp. T187]